MSLATLLGALVGLVLGLTGAGGGVLALPALTLGLRMSLAEAVPVSLIAVATASILGALAGLCAGQVRYRAALLMATLGVITAPVGFALGQRLPPLVLAVSFCAVMFLIAARMLSGAFGTRRGAASRGSATNCSINT